MNRETVKYRKIGKKLCDIEEHEVFLIYLKTIDNPYLDWMSTYTVSIFSVGVKKGLLPSNQTPTENKTY